MAHPKRTELTVRLERAILVGVLLPDRPVDREEPLEELGRLADTAGAKVVSRIVQKRRSVDATYFVGKGKATELHDLAKRLDADVIIFDHDLSPAQLRNLEVTTDTKVVDRSDLILDIFATHARTQEAKVQVELAQLEYTLPRLTRMWTHLGRIVGGIGQRGPGEQQLEVDRRAVRKHIADLKKTLAGIEMRKEREVKAREDEFCVSIVGYTNAGKSTLMNALTGAGVLVEDKLFATLETRTRPWGLPGGRRVLLSDTVGFIRNLPHHLVASFNATLEEAENADLLLHVVDATSPAAPEQVEAVDAVLKDIGCGEMTRLLVLNKSDAVTDLAALNVLAATHSSSVVVSALTGSGLHDLGTAVAAQMSKNVLEVALSFPAAEGRIFAGICQRGEILSRGFADNSVEVRARIGRKYLYKLVRDFPAIKFLPDSPFVPEPGDGY
jgi:GTP-binding protein HflX